MPFRKKSRSKRRQWGGDKIAYGMPRIRPRGDIPTEPHGGPSTGDLRTAGGSKRRKSRRRSSRRSRRRSSRRSRRRSSRRSRRRSSRRSRRRSSRRQKGGQKLLPNDEAAKKLPPQKAGGKFYKILI